MDTTRTGANQDMDPVAHRTHLMNFHDNGKDKIKTKKLWNNKVRADFIGKIDFEGAAGLALKKTAPDGNFALISDFEPAPHQTNYVAPMTLEIERIMARGCLRGYMVEVFRSSEADKIILFILYAVPWIGKYIMDNAYKCQTF